MTSAASPAPLDPLSVARVMSRCGLPARVPVDEAGLRAAYAAWCRSVPFDNVRKMLALAEGGDSPLPGMDPGRFFEEWLRDGAGGTCWPTNGALTALLLALGFDARRVGSAMRDLGLVNHGTCVVRVDGGERLVDSSMLFGVPLPIAAAPYVRRDLPLYVEFERDGGDPVFWFDVPSDPVARPCRLVVDPIPYADTVATFERSRLKSPFNARLYVRRIVDDRLTVLNGTTLSWATAGARATRELGGDEILDFLREQVGLAPALVERWRAAGCLAASLKPSPDPPPPAPSRPPPSRRG
jgi:N-hydroxyarylamine O-acetyltransferase